MPLTAVLIAALGFCSFVSFDSFVSFSPQKKPSVTVYVFAADGRTLVA